MAIQLSNRKFLWCVYKSDFPYMYSEIAVSVALLLPRNDNNESIQSLDGKHSIFYAGYMEDKVFYVYIMTNLHNTTLYTGITNDLYRRVQEHKRGEGGRFSRIYKLKKLVYFEVYYDAMAAIDREKQIKGGSRMKKLELIEEINPEWNDLIFDYFS